MEKSEARKAVERMQNYIQQNIAETITLSDLAQVAGYSLYHAARLFKQETGFAPFEYVRKQRIIASAFSLRRGDKRVVDVAFDHMFASHEGYTRAFSKAFGIAPKSFLMLPKPTDWLIPYRTIHHPKRKLEDHMMTKNTAIIFTQIVERPARKLLIKRGINASDYFEYCEELGCHSTQTSDPWEVLVQIKSALNEPAGCWIPKHLIKEGTSEYVQGVEVPIDYAEDIPDGFDLIDLEPCKMLVFQGEPYDDAHYDEAIGALWERIKVFNPEVYGYTYADELAPKMQLEPQGWRGYIELHPIKEKI